ncbi:MAG: fasciclin domain-containing protein [Ilumatobacteraceae bacterium]
MSRLSRAARRTAAVTGLVGACLAPFILPPSASAGTSTLLPPPVPATTVPHTTPAPKPQTIAGLLAPFAAGFDIDNNNFNVATHLVLKFPDLVAAATKPGNVTVFLPTDYAFRRLVKALTGTVVVDESKLVSTLMLMGKDRIGHLLRHHVAPGVRVQYRRLANGTVPTLRTLDGGRLAVKVTTRPRRTVWLGDAAPALTDAKVIRADVIASNGLLHVVDQVILPFAP